MPRTKVYIPASRYTIHMPQTSKDEQVYLHIIGNAQDEQNFGKTLFYKILYFSDFDYYEKNNKPITGDKYRHITHGPAPTHFDNIVEQLKRKGLIKETHRTVADKTQVRYHLCIPNEQVDSTLLSKEELNELNRNIRRLSGMTAAQASAYSNQDMPVKATPDREIIDYDLVHYRNAIFSVSENKN